MAPKTLKAVDNPFAQFTFVDTLPSEFKVQQTANTVESRRAKMLNVISTQHELWKNLDKLGKTALKRVGKRDMRCWSRIASDQVTVYVTPTYGTRKLELVPGKPTVKLNIAQVDQFFEAIKDAVFRGQLDDQLKALSDATGAALRAGRAAKKAA